MVIDSLNSIFHESIPYSYLEHAHLQVVKTKESSDAELKLSQSLSATLITC